MQDETSEMSDKVLKSCRDVCSMEARPQLISAADKIKGMGFVGNGRLPM
jgi:hypothetical protein